MPFEKFLRNLCSEFFVKIKQMPLKIGTFKNFRDGDVPIYELETSFKNYSFFLVQKPERLSHFKIVILVLMGIKSEQYSIGIIVCIYACDTA